MAFNSEDFEQKVVSELSLDEVPSCYNLRLDVAPVMLLREENRCEGESHDLEVLWPEKKTFKMKEIGRAHV